MATQGHWGYRRDAVGRASYGSDWKVSLVSFFCLLSVLMRNSVSALGMLPRLLCLFLRSCKETRISSELSFDVNTHKSVWTCYPVIMGSEFWCFLASGSLWRPGGGPHYGFSLLMMYTSFVCLYFRKCLVSSAHVWFQCNRRKKGFCTNEPHTRGRAAVFSGMTSYTKAGGVRKRWGRKGGFIRGSESIVWKG